MPNQLILLVIDFALGLNKKKTSVETIGRQWRFDLLQIFYWACSPAKSKAVSVLTCAATASTKNTFVKQDMTFAL